MKFGGTSVEDATAFERVAALVRAAARDSRPVVVVSAMSRFTDALLAAFERAAEGQGAGALAHLEEHFGRHAAALRALLSDLPKKQEADVALSELEGVLADARAEIGRAFAEAAERARPLPVAARPRRLLRRTALFVAARARARRARHQSETGGLAPLRHHRRRARLRHAAQRRDRPPHARAVGALDRGGRRPRARRLHRLFGRDGRDDDARARRLGLHGGARRRGPALEGDSDLDGRVGRAHRRPARRPRGAHHPAPLLRGGGRAGLLRREGSAPEDHSAGRRPQRPRPHLQLKGAEVARHRRLLRRRDDAAHRQGHRAQEGRPHRPHHLGADARRLRLPARHLRGLRAPPHGRRYRHHLRGLGLALARRPRPARPRSRRI